MSAGTSTGGSSTSITFPMTSSIRSHRSSRRDASLVRWTLGGGAPPVIASASKRNFEPDRRKADRVLVGQYRDHGVTEQVHRRHAGRRNERQPEHSRERHLRLEAIEGEVTLDGSQRQLHQATRA